MMHPNLVDQLEMFVTAAELGTFSATARKMGRAQNVVSYGISSLETSLNVKLFDRSGHKAVLTPTGIALQRQAQNIVNAAHDLSRTADEFSAGVEPVLTVAIDDMIPFDFFEHALATVAEEYPGLELRLNRTAGQEAHSQVKAGQAALGICVSGFDMHKDQPFTLVSHLKMVPVISPVLKVNSIQDAIKGSDPAEHLGHRQIVLSATETPEATLDQGVISPHIWRVPDIKSKYDLILRGFGWGMLPAHLVDADLAAGVLHQMKLPFITSLPGLPVFVFSQIDIPLGPAARLFREQVIGVDNIQH
jgi:DNA-binding transcriptional LysR family regulator